MSFLMLLSSREILYHHAKPNSPFIIDIHINTVLGLLWGPRGSHVGIITLTFSKNFLTNQIALSHWIYFSTLVSLPERNLPYGTNFPLLLSGPGKKHTHTVLKNNNESRTIKLAHNECHKYIITMSHLVQYPPALPKTAHSDSSCPYEGPGLCSCISMSLSRLPGMVALVTGFWLRGTLITPRNEFPLGGRLGECKSREVGVGVGSKKVWESWGPGRDPKPFWFWDGGRNM